MAKSKRIFSVLVTVLTVFTLTACAQLPRAKASAEEKPAMPGMEGRVMAMSKYDFNETVSRVKQAIEAQGLMVVFTVDHQAMLEMVGLKTGGMLGIEFFHPKYGKVIAQNDHRAGIEIPLRLVVMEGDMETIFSYYKPSYTFSKYPKLADLGRELDGVLSRIQEAVTK